MSSLFQSTPELDSSIDRLLQNRSQTHPDAIALLAPQRPPLTYRRLQHHIEQVVDGLKAIGIGRSDRVAVALPNGPEMAVAFLAIASCATCAPLNPNYRESEFEFYLSDLNPKALIYQSGVAEAALKVAHPRGIVTLKLSPILAAEAGIFKLTEGPPKTALQGGLAESNDVALVLHTSGTTSRPKIVPLTHCNLCTSVHNIGKSLLAQSLIQTPADQSQFEEIAQLTLEILKTEEQD